MPYGRHGMGAALGADGRIYVIGGALSYSKPRGRQEVFIYDTRTNSWDRGPSLNRARFHHAVAGGADGKIYVIGGHERKLLDNEPSASVEMLDTSVTPWRDEGRGWKSNHDSVIGSRND